MSYTAEALRELHRIHRQLTDVRERFERGPKQVRAREANLTRLGEELTKIQADVKAARVRADQKQLLLKSGEEKIKGLKAKLNAATSNREYQAIKDQIAADEMANSVLADETLEALEKDRRVPRNGGRSAKENRRRQRRTGQSPRSGPPRVAGLGRRNPATWRPNSKRPSRESPTTSRTIISASSNRRGPTPWPKCKTAFAAAATSNSRPTICPS